MIASSTLCDFKMNKNTMGVRNVWLFVCTCYAGASFSMVSLSSEKGQISSPDKQLFITRDNIKYAEIVWSCVMYRISFIHLQILSFNGYLDS